LNRHTISIGGSRRPTPDGNQIAQRSATGLALGVLVAEGAQYSGSLITAMEFGREVYGVPGNTLAVGAISL